MIIIYLTIVDVSVTYLKASFKSVNQPKIRSGNSYRKAFIHKL